MATLRSIDPLSSFTTFGEMLHYLRRQARLSQRELAVAVGYSESMISRLEHDERPPDLATIHALFVPALGLEKQPVVIVCLAQLAQRARQGAENAIKNDAPGETPDDVARLRHFATYSIVADALGNRVLGPEHRQAIAELDAKYDQIRAAFAYGRGKPELAEHRLRMAAALAYYWLLRGLVAEGAEWLRDAIADGRSASLAAQALAYVALLVVNGDDIFRWNLNLSVMQESVRLVEQAEGMIEPCRQQEEIQAMALLLLTVGGTFDYYGNFAKSEDYVTTAIRLFAELGNVRGEQFARIVLARSALAQGNVQLAQAELAETARFCTQNELGWGLCQTAMLQFEIDDLTHDYTGTIRNLTRIAELGEREGFIAYVHDAYYRLEHVDPLVARRLAEDFLARQRASRPSVMLALALHQLGRMYCNAQQFERAELILDEAVTLWRSLGISHGHGLGSQSSLLDRGQAKRLGGKCDASIADYSESIALYAAASFTRGGIFPILFRGHARMEMGDLDGALKDFRQSLEEAKKRQVWSKLISNTLAAIGEAAHQLGNEDAAGKLLAAAAAAEERRRKQAAQNETWDKAYAGLFNEVADFKRIMAATAVYRQEPIFAAAWQKGERMSLDEAVELASSWQAPSNRF